MDLPAEVRLLIYEMLFRDPVSVILVSTTLYPIPHDPRLPLAFLRVCKAIYTEALPVLYGRNTFRIPCLFPQGYEQLGIARVVLPNVTLIRRVFENMHPDDPIVREEIATTYRDMGIQWDKLHLFAISVNGRVKEPVAKANEDWLYTPRDKDELKKLGIDARFIGRPSDWLVRKGSTVSR